jgi:ubiquilin
MAPISVKIKCSNETAFSITVDSTETVSALKTLIEKHFELTTPTPSSSQRLIFAGKVLKDDDTLESYKLQEGNTYYRVNIVFIWYVVINLLPQRQ